MTALPLVIRPEQPADAEPIERLHERAFGPLTVDPAFEKRGIGGALIRRSMDAARAADHRLVLLVGDAPYYGRFGFRRVPPGQLTLPGPVDPERFLAAELADGALAGARGTVLAR